MVSKVLLSSTKSKLTPLIDGSTWMFMKGRNFGFTQMEKVTLANPPFPRYKLDQSCRRRKCQFHMCIMYSLAPRALPFSLSRRKWQNQRIENWISYDEITLAGVLFWAQRESSSSRTQRAWKLKFTKWCFGFFCASIATCFNYHADLLWRSTCLSHCSNSQFTACCDFKVAQTIWKVGFAWKYDFYFFSSRSGNDSHLKY